MLQGEVLLPSEFLFAHAHGAHSAAHHLFGEAAFAHRI